MASIKRDDVKQKWEESEFPLVCETCLGDNPYVRMTKEAHGKQCKICESPFTVFAWQAGTKGRLKKVEICKSCAQAKNVCQVCIYDLQYGLPVAVRDKILRENAASGDSTALVANVPQSHANRSWYTAQQERALEQGRDLVPTNEFAHAKLQSMARMEPRYERNLPKLCSFFARGECDRGTKCPFRHELPRDRNDPLSQQNTKDRFYGTTDPVAGKSIARQKRIEEKQNPSANSNTAEKRGGKGFDERSRTTLYVRYHDRDRGGATIQTPKMAEGDVRDAFYSFGEIVAVRMHLDKGAFVEFTQPQATELAIATMNRKEIQGASVFVAWARAPKRGNAAAAVVKRGDSANANATLNGEAGVIRPAPPPSAGRSNDGAGASLGARKPLPPGLVPVRVPVAGGISSNVPRPGGGPIRAVGRAAAKGVVGSSFSSKPYYPSADPNRLGSQTNAGDQ